MYQPQTSQSWVSLPASQDGDGVVGGRVVDVDGVRFVQPLDIHGNQLGAGRHRTRALRPARLSTRPLLRRMGSSCPLGERPRPAVKPFRSRRGASAELESNSLNSGPAREKVRQAFHSDRGSEGSDEQRLRPGNPRRAATSSGRRPGSSGSSPRSTSSRGASSSSPGSRAGRASSGSPRTTTRT